MVHNTEQGAEGHFYNKFLEFLYFASDCRFSYVINKTK